MKQDYNHLIFVNYISRSGSTFLCSELAKLPGTSVGIEAGFPGFPDRLIPRRFHPIKSHKQLEVYLNLLYSDIRFQQWNINRPELTSALDSIGYPIQFSDVFKTCFQSYFSKHGLGSYWVHKAGGYMNDFEFCNEQFPKAKHIFVVRDPRSVYSSQKNANDLYSDGTMGTNVISFVSDYKRRVSRALQLSKRFDNVMIVRYESMVDNLDLTLESIKSFINYEYQNLTLAGENYLNRIPDNQKSLHSNVGQAAKPELKNKWKTGLSNLEHRYIEYALGKLMNYFDYQLTSELSVSFIERISIDFIVFRNRLRKKLKTLLLDFGLLIK